MAANNDLRERLKEMRAEIDLMIEAMDVQQGDAETDTDNGDGEAEGEAAEVEETEKEADEVEGEDSVAITTVDAPAPVMEFISGFVLKEIRRSNAKRN